jgi:hypothetical protein
MRRRVRIVNKIFSYCVLVACWGIKVSRMSMKNPHAVALGKMGGSKGGKRRAAKMSPEDRSASAKKAALARWAKQKKER